MPLGFDARAVLGYEPLTVGIANCNGSKVLRHLSQREANRLINSWADLLDEQTPWVVITVTGLVSKESE